MKDTSPVLGALSGTAVRLRWLTGAAFFATLVLIPVRLRIVLLSRPDPPVQSDYTDFLLFAADIAMLATLAFWALSLLAAPHRIRLGPRFLWMPLAATSLAGLLSIATSVDGPLTLYHALRLAGLFLFFLYVVNELNATSLLLSAVAVQGVIQAAVAIAQFLTQRSIGLQALGEHLLDPAWNGVSILSTGSDRILRAYGLSDHPNILGGSLAFGLVLLLALFLRANRKTQLVLLIAFLPMSVALLLTFSRAAWLAFAAGAAFLAGTEIAFHRWSALKPLLWLTLAAALAVAPFASRVWPLLGMRLNTDGGLQTVGVEQQSLGERSLLIHAAIPIFAAHPLTGIGLGAAPVAMRNQYPELNLEYQPPHFTLLESALETGSLGGVSYLLLMILPWIYLLRHRQLLAQPRLAGAAALLLAVTVVGFFDYYTWLLVPGRLWQWSAWGLVAASVRKEG